MNFDLQNRLNSYQPFWNDWNLNQDIYLDRFPNVYKIINQVDGSFSMIKVFTINNEIFANTLKCTPNEVKDNLIKIIKSIVHVNILKDCDTVARYSDYLIKEILQEGHLIGYDIILRIDNAQCLTEKINHNTHFTQNDVISMLYDISKVLSVAHIKGLIHKYINLQTIFIDNDGLYKLGDFGIYSLLSTSKDITYLAPEVLNGKRSNVQSDIYSLGLVAYQLLNNNQFTKASNDGTLSTINDVNSNLMKIIQKMCALEPSNRYSSIDDLILDLNSLDIKPHINSDISKFKDNSKKETIINKSDTNSIKDNTPQLQSKLKEDETSNDTENIIKSTEVISNEDTYNIIPSIVVCAIVGFIISIFGFMLYKNLSSNSNDISNDVVQNMVETTTITTDETSPTITTTVATTEEYTYTTYSHVILTVTEENTTPTTTQQITTTPIPTTTSQTTTTTVPTTTITTTSKDTTTSSITTTTSASTSMTTTTEKKSENVKHNYYFKKGSYTWEEAYNDASANGYQLATFTNSDELNIIRKIAQNSGLKYFWLGGKVNIYTDDDNVSYAYCYWQNGDDNTYLNSKDARWYYSEKYQVQEPSGWDINTHELEPYIMIWYLDNWTLCDNGVDACSNGDISGYIYMD